MPGRKGRGVSDKYERRFDNIEKESRDSGRYGKNRKAVPPKILDPAKAKDNLEEEALDEEVKKMATKEKQSKKDPICGKNIDPQTSKFKTKHKGEEYAFCCQNCLNQFQKEPEKYV